MCCMNVGKLIIWRSFASHFGVKQHPEYQGIARPVLFVVDPSRKKPK